MGRAGGQSDERGGLSVVAQGRRTAGSDEPPEEVACALAEAKNRVAGIEEWTLEHWHEAIARMRRLSAEQRLGLHDPDHLNVIDLPYGPGLVGGVGQIDVETVQVIERPLALEQNQTYSGPLISYTDAPKDIFALRDVGHLISIYKLPVMIVSLEQSDEHILSEVERVLTERRNSKKSVVLPRLPGRRALSRSLQSGYAGKKWKKYRIVELVEMLAWNATEGRRYPKNRIGFWIDNNLFRSDRKTSEAIAVARQAIAALPAILTEVGKTRLPS